MASVAIHRLERADADTDAVCVPLNRLEEIQQRCAVIQIPPVRPEMHAGHRNLPIAGAAHAVDLVQHVLQRTTASYSASRRNDAVGADLIAAGLHAERECRPARQSRRNLRAAAALAVAEPLGRAQADFPREVVFSFVGDDLHDARKAGDLVGTPRRVAAGDDDSGVGVFTRDLSDDLPRALIGCARDRTRIYDDEIGVVRPRCAGTSGGNQLLLNLEGVRLVHAATERDNGIFHGRN